MLFISHSSEDKDYVQRLAIDLLNRDFDVWLDGWQLEVGDELSVRLRDAVEHGDGLLLVLSPAALRSPWVELEVSTALEREQALGTTQLFPIRIAPCHPPPPIGDRLFADFTTGYNASFERLSDQLSERLEGTPPPPPELELVPLRFQGSYDLDEAQLSARLRTVFSRLPPGFALSRRQFVFAPDRGLDDAWMRLYRQLDHLEADPATDPQTTIKVRDRIQGLKRIDRELVEGLMILLNECRSAWALPSACAMHARLNRHQLLGSMWEALNLVADPSGYGVKNPNEYGSDAVLPAWGTDNLGNVLPLAQLRLIDVYERDLLFGEEGPEFLFTAFLDAQSDAVQTIENTRQFLPLSDMDRWLMWSVLVVQAIQRSWSGSFESLWTSALGLSRSHLA